MRVNRILELERNRYLAIVRADSISVWLPTPQTIEVDYHYDLAFARRMIHRVDVHDPRQLDIQIWTGSDYRVLSTPSYTMNLRPEVKEF
jgi:hypothetical protein